MNREDIIDKVRAAYNAILPAPIRYDINVPDKAKLLYAEINATTNHLGYCDKSNQYFGDILGVSPRSITQYINLLTKRKYIEIEVLTNRRRIKLPMVQVAFIQPPTLKTGDGIEDELKRWMDDYLNKWCELMSTKLYKPSLYYKTILERLREFSKEEMTEAMLNRVDFVKNSEWHQQKENAKYAKKIDLLIRDEKSLLKHLTMDRNSEDHSDEVNSFKVDANKDLLE